MRRWPWIVLAVLFLSAPLVAWGVRRRVDHEWERMSARTAERLAEIRSRRIGQPGDAGRIEPGDPWEAYDRAIARAAALPDDLDAELEAFAQGQPIAHRANLVERIASESAVVEDLQRGARRARAAPFREWERGLSMPLPAEEAVRRAVLMAACRARLRDEEGRAREAVGVLLDVGIYADDFGRNGILFHERISEEIGAIVAIGILDVLPRLTIQDAAYVASRIEVLESGRPRGAMAWSNDLVRIGIEVEHGPDFTGDGQFAGEITSWRYGFSTELAAAAGIHLAYDLADRARDLDRMSWPEARRLAAEIDAEMLVSPGPMAPILPRLDGIQAERALLAQLRLIRMAVQWRATGEAPAIADPFGETLRWSVSTGSLRAWSVGPDGVDDGGNGGWTEGADLVLRSSSP